MIGNSSGTAASTELARHCFEQGLLQRPDCSKVVPSSPMGSSMSELSGSKLVINSCCFDYITFGLAKMNQRRFGYSRLVILHVIELFAAAAHSHQFHYLPSCCYLVLLDYSVLFACHEQPGY